MAHVHSPEGSFFWTCGLTLRALATYKRYSLWVETFCLDIYEEGRQVKQQLENGYGGSLRNEDLHDRSSHSSRASAVCTGQSHRTTLNKCQLFVSSKFDL